MLLTLLETEGLTIEKLLDQDDITIDIKSNYTNDSLIKFMTKANLRKLFNYATKMPANPSNEQESYKFPFVAAEILSADIDFVTEFLMGSDKEIKEEAIKKEKAKLESPTLKETEKEPETKLPEPTKETKDEAKKEEAKKDEAKKEEAKKEEAKKEEAKKEEATKEEAKKDEAKKDEEHKDDKNVLKVKQKDEEINKPTTDDSEKKEIDDASTVATHQEE